MKDYEKQIFENVKSALADFLSVAEDNDAPPIIQLARLKDLIGPGRFAFDRVTDLRNYLTENTARLNLAGVGVKPLSNGRYQLYRSLKFGEGSAALTVDAIRSLADEHLTKAAKYLEALEVIEGKLLDAEAGDQ